MKQEHSLEFLAPHHDKILMAAALEDSHLDLSSIIQGAQRLIGYGCTKYGYGPACIIDVISTEHVIEPHVIWFPWTRPKDRIINFKWAMNFMLETHQVLLNVQENQKSFFDHFAKKGFLRKIGFIENLPIVQEIHMYQVKGDKHD